MNHVIAAKCRAAASVLLVSCLGASVGLGVVAIAVTGNRSTVTAPQVVERNGRAVATLHVLLENRTRATRRYTVTLADAHDAVLQSARAQWRVASGAVLTVPVVVELPISSFSAGRRPIYVRIDDDIGTQRVVTIVVRLTSLPTEPARP
jgi:hypothetical protein